MADVITRFKLENTQFDSKLRDTAKALKDIAHQASLGGKDFNDFNQKAIENARALGTVQSGANNTKDKLRDLVGSYNDAAKAYNSLTDTAKKGEFGQAMSQSLTQLQQRIRETKQELYGLGDGMKGASGGSMFSSDKLSGMLQVFGGNLMTKGAGMALSFAGELKDMVAQGIELAKQGEGIRIAFQRLGRGDILDGLREATHGTVTDLELMKAAVKFNDFKLPLDELGTMLAFAQQKAKDTGQSVDYMVDSIVTGLGRKSLMILDNLGLSAAEVKEKMAETGDMTKAVGEIIREQMSKAGDYVETAADRATQANVSLQNKMEELGRKFAPIEEASNQLWTSMKIGILDVVGGPLAKMLNSLTEAGRLMNALSGNNGEQGSGNTKVDQQLNKLRGSNYKQFYYNKVVENYTKQINDLQAQINNGGKKPGAGSGTSQDVRYLTAQKQSLEVMLGLFRSGAKDIMQPVKADIKTDSGNTSGGGGGSTTTTTTKHQTPQQRAQESFTKAEQNYKQALDQAAMELQAGTITRAEAKKKEMQAAEARWRAIGDARNINDSENLRKAQDEAAANYKALAAEVKTATEHQKAIDKATRELENANQKLAAARTEMAQAKQQGDLQAYNTAKNKATAAQQEITRLEKVKVDVETGRVNLPEIPTEITQKVDFQANTRNLDAFIGNLKQQLSQADMGSDLYNNLTAQLSDATLLGNLMQTAIKNGIDVAQFNPQELWSKVFSDNPGDYISNEEWQKKLGVISQKTGRKLQFNPQTGEIREKPKKGNGGDSEGLEKFSKDFSAITGSVNGILSGIQNLGIEIPEGLAKTIGVIQTISGILTAILAITTAIQATSTADATASWIDAIIPFARGGVIPTFAQGGLIGRAAGGMMIPGNSMSGDRLRLPVDGGRGMIGVNSGELILNRAQQGVIASQLEGGMGAMQLSAIITGEQLRLVLNNNGRRTGRGEYVTTNFR